MAKDNDGILSFINFRKLSLITNKLKDKLGKCVKGVEKKSKERSQYMKWIVSLYESLPPYVDKTDINDSQLQTDTSYISRTFERLFSAFGFFHKLWINYSNNE